MNNALSNLALLLKKPIITSAKVVNQVYLHRAASQRHHSLALSTQPNLSRMRPQLKHRQVASLETLPPNRHRQAVFSGTPPPSPDRQAASSVVQPSQYRQVAYLATPRLSHNKEACSAPTKIKLEATSNSNRALLSLVAIRILSPAEAFSDPSKITNRPPLDSLALQTLSSLSLHRPISSVQ